MSGLWRVAGLACLLAAGSFAATISYTGKVTDASGSYAVFYPVGTVVTGTFTADTVSEDLDETSELGVYLVTNGSWVIQVGENTLTGTADESNPFSVSTFYSEGLQQFMLSGTFGIGGVLTALFEGGNGPGGEFLTSDAFPSNPVWSNLTFAYGTVESTIVPTALAPGAFGDQLVYTIDPVGEVPEPGTVFGVAAGGLLLWLKRRRA